MNFLSVQNNFGIKSHNNSFLLSTEPPLKTATYADSRLTENNNQEKTTTLQEVWSKEKFNVGKVTERASVYNNLKMSWADEQPIRLQEESQQSEEVTEEPQKETKEIEVDQSSNKEETPSHHARRPPNAFLIFCKKHRPIVRERFPNLENRGVTKILGEWWALLNNVEKQPYNDLAKEYKDAFLSANPNFRWYKLPAPPLRTLTARPAVPKPGPPISSTASTVGGDLPTVTTPPSAEFTPGKLADESQLGGLTSLMNNNCVAPSISEAGKGECCLKEDVQSKAESSPVSNIDVSTPPKPIKKRFSDYYLENKGCVRNLGLQDMHPPKNEEIDREGEGNLTNQDLMNKVVDDMFIRHQDDSEDKNGLKEVRKSERMCKGKRYEMFMVEGKLLGNRRETKFVQRNRIDTKIEMELNAINNNKPETPKLDLGNTIKRLAERTNVKIDLIDGQSENLTNTNVNTMDFLNQTTAENLKRTRSISETSESNNNNKSALPNFNLDLRISHLPCLSYDEFTSRKRESKKRKIRAKTDGESRHKVSKMEAQPVGSKKRKNKQSITHLSKSEEDEAGLSGDLLGLATLAEVAANTEKINEQLSE
ncbi:unnamed protein product [Acanthoscelides obtectus]|uniref:HMG box domain-containing protein n=1 Tax=Acanthoscelides obtectus TaxID=200917 RepID=A0A9P0L6V5_ACAOB|nr:unnamed protein product [Acanthoscelides obtectus]CAK1662790.1 HMG box transcription factor BBX [Acanthoscelides obtectus]